MKILLAILALLFSFSVFSNAFSGAPSSSRIVKIITTKGDYGSGWVTAYNSTKTLITTNLHVCSENYYKWNKDKDNTPLVFNRLTINNDLNQLYYGYMIAYDKERDICFIEVEGVISSNPLKVAKRYKMNYNDKLEVLSPLPFGRRELSSIEADNASNEDIWSAVHKDSFVAEGTTQAGQSGSPVLLNGEVVGVFWGRTTHPDQNGKNYAFFIDIKAFWDLFNKMKLNNKYKLK